jgi:hypothetical protein
MRSPDYGESPLYVVFAGLDSVDKHVGKYDFMDAKFWPS